MELRPLDVVPFGSFLAHVPGAFQFVTYTFVHQNFLHLFFNMLFLFVFADNVEDAMGSFRFVFFYAICGAVAAVVHSWLTVRPNSPARWSERSGLWRHRRLLMQYPNVRVWVLLPLPNFPFLPLRFSAAFMIGVWNPLSDRQCRLFR